jgi:hypothetical protein
MINAIIYTLIGLSFYAFMVVDDVRHGRKIQKRDHHILFFWPAVLFVVFILGLFEFSRLTSSEDGKLLQRPESWL